MSLICKKSPQSADFLHAWREKGKKRSATSRPFPFAWRQRSASKKRKRRWWRWYIGFSPAGCCYCLLLTASFGLLFLTLLLLLLTWTKIEKKGKMQATSRSTHFLIVSSPSFRAAAVHRSDYLNTLDGSESSAVLNESKCREEDPPKSWFCLFYIFGLQNWTRIWYWKR